MTNEDPIEEPADIPPKENPPSDFEKKTQNVSLGGFFNSIRTWGAFRPTARSGPGVASALADKFKMQVGLVRFLFIIAAVLLGVGVLLYGIAWLLLPQQEDGRIHLEDMLAGRFSAGGIGSILLILAGFNDHHDLVFFHGAGFFALVIIAAILARRWWVWVILIFLAAGSLFSAIFFSTPFHHHEVHSKGHSYSSEYDFGAGDNVVDLTDADIPQGAQVNVHSSAGELKVILPSGAKADVETNLKMGSLSWDVASSSGETAGMGIHKKLSFGKGDPALKVNINMGAGDVEILEGS